jgi:hypothetical protein
MIARAFVSKLNEDSESQFLQMIASFTIVTMAERISIGNSGQAATTAARSGYTGKSSVALLVARVDRDLTLGGCDSLAFWPIDFDSVHDIISRIDLTPGLQAAHALREERDDTAFS